MSVFCYLQNQPPIPKPDEKVIPQPDAWDGGGCKYVGAVRWTRFGEIDTFRWNRRDTEDLSEWK